MISKTHKGQTGASESRVALHYKHTKTEWNKKKKERENVKEKRESVQILTRFHSVPLLNSESTRHWGATSTLILQTSTVQRAKGDVAQFGNNLVTHFLNSWWSTSHVHARPRKPIPAKKPVFLLTGSSPNSIYLTTTFICIKPNVSIAHNRIETMFSSFQIQQETTCTKCQKTLYVFRWL